MLARIAPPFLLLGALAGCALTPPPAQVRASLDCAEGVVDRYGFLDREGNWFSGGSQPQDPAGFIAQRGDSLSREVIYVTAMTQPATGAVRLNAWGNGYWTNAGRPTTIAGSAAEEVARVVRDECGGSAKPHSQI